jgi:hypothetical protein
VELAKLVNEGWTKVPSNVLIRSAIKCGVARVEDYPPAIREAADQREVYVDPIIRDLVQRDAPVSDWSMIQTDSEDESANLKELGSLSALIMMTKIAQNWKICKAAMRRWSRLGCGFSGWGSGYRCWHWI